MSKSGKKSFQKQKGSRKERAARQFKNDVKRKSNGRSITLSDYIKHVREDYVNLNTTCNHNCTCCKVAMPSMNLCQFVDMVTEIWSTYTNEQKLELIFKSVEYFFRYDYTKWGMDSLIKPCMFLDENGLCKHYSKRPLNCSLYGLWPQKDYESRVDKFAKAYEPLGLKREDLPLNTQCPNVKRVDDKVEITSELIQSLFDKLDDMDKKMGNYTTLQIAHKENYRTFADWLLLKVFGEDFLVKLTNFAMAADKATMQDQIKVIREVFTKEFAKTGLPDIMKLL